MPWKVIEFQDPTGEIMVARVPPEGTAELVSGSQLIVQEGQIGVFFHEGKPTDAFRAGRYNLSTQNLPVLSKLLKLVTLSASPFRSYVYFIALKTFTDLGWGTTSPILFRDREFRMINLRANGAFAVRIANPKVFLHTIVGTQGLETTFALQQYLRKIIVAKLAKILAEVLTTVIDLPLHYEEISTRVKSAVREDFQQYGVELVDLLIEAIVPPEEVVKAIDRATGTRAVGRDEIQHYGDVMRADALRDAAAQPGSDVAAVMAAGFGLGAGARVVHDMLGQPGGAVPPPIPPAAGETIEARLLRLKSLLDKGLIEPHEYESQKKRLLDQL